MQRYCSFILTSIALLASLPALAGESDLPEAKPVPDVQVLPLPHDEASFVHLGRELTRFHFVPTLQRPFLYPLVGPAGVSYTRMGHPHDPVSHSHHNSVWISHQSVGGVSFWEDRTPARIICQRVEQYEDGPEQAWLLAVNAWQASDGKTVLVERRRIAVEPLEGGQWRMAIDLELRPPDDRPVTLGETGFGIIGVRMAKTIGVLDGGGRILDSEGRLGEAEIFRQPSRWVDYSGPVRRDATGGITLMDHPANPNHPAPFHVRGDGWMGACLTLSGPLVIEPQKPLRLRYGLWVHAGVPARAAVEPLWKAFAEEPLPSMERQPR